MKSANNLGTRVAIYALIGLAAVTAVRAEPVEFLFIRDAVESKYFDSSTTAPDPSNPNTLIVGFHSGFNREFKASTGSGSRMAMDTLNVWVSAPTGTCISNITYWQTGASRTGRTGKVAGNVSWVLNGSPVVIGSLSSQDPTASSTVDLSDRCRRSVMVAVTNALAAFATPSGSASISTNYAEIMVELMWAVGP